MSSSPASRVIVSASYPSLSTRTSAAWSTASWSRRGRRVSGAELTLPPPGSLSSDSESVSCRDKQPSVLSVDRPDMTRVWRPDWPCAVRNVLAQQRRGAGDPTMRLAAPGERGPHWRASRTPEGPVTLAIESRDAAGDVRAQAWGPGADWALDQLPDLLGAADDWTGFEARHPVVAEAWRRYPHVRLGRTGAAARGAGADDHRAEGHRQGGVHRLPLARAQVRRARARSGRSASPPPARRRPPWRTSRPGPGSASTSTPRAPVPWSPRPGTPTPSSGSSAAPAAGPRTWTARSGACPVSGRGPARRCGSAPSATRTRCRSATTT